jgi:hypothetical protein
MRRISILITGMAGLAALSACSKPNSVTNSATAPAGFVPPTALSRTDFTTMVTRRFEQLDVNHDLYLDKAELPVRHHDIIAAFDTNGDGKVSKDEFIKGSLARFDAADRNQDQVLTGEERRSADLGADTGEGNTTANASGPIGS